MTAQDFVILAAGLGSRLAPTTNNTPKGLVPVAGKPIIFHTLDVLAKKIEEQPLRVTIVVGHLGEKLVEAISERYSFINILYNNDYINTNNAFSLYLHLATRNERCPLNFMNGDCVYDKEIIDLCLSAYGSTIFFDPAAQYNNESMKISGSIESVQAISKEMSQEKALGISCDIYHLTAEHAVQLRQRCFETIRSGELNLWSEAILNRLLQAGDVVMSATSVNGCPWYEVDNFDDLAAANRLFEGRL